MDHLIIFVLFVGVMFVADMVTRLTWWIVDKRKLGKCCNTSRVTTVAN